ncbi:four helix bundle protein [Flavobacterium sp. GP15]|uniref:four helix bundle protein n=1 Tax=Flavobacterium sp. GP15 TaxID=2758567 RepID=UPI00351C80FD
MLSKKLILGKNQEFFNRRIYSNTKSFNIRKDFDLFRQIRLVSISISSNIAEGFERNTDKEFIYFLYVARKHQLEKSVLNYIWRTI